MPDDLSKIELSTRDAARLAMWPELVAALELIEWADAGRCYLCEREGYQGHRQNCDIGATLARARELE